MDYDSLQSEDLRQALEELRASQPVLRLHQANASLEGLRWLCQVAPPLPVYVDPDVPPGEIEFRYRYRIPVVSGDGHDEED